MPESGAGFRYFGCSERPLMRKVEPQDEGPLRADSSPSNGLAQTSSERRYDKTMPD